jgi:hypothetical protein
MLVFPEPGNPVNHMTGKWAILEGIDEVFGFIFSICFSSPLSLMGVAKRSSQIKESFSHMKSITDRYLRGFSFVIYIPDDGGVI